MESTDNDFLDTLGEHTSERAAESDSGCTSRELLWVDVYLHTNSVLQANRVAEYAGTDRPESKAIKRELIKRQSILINRSVMSLEESIAAVAHLHVVAVTADEVLRSATIHE